MKKLVGRFLGVELAWATGISMLMVAVSAMSSDSLHSEDVVRWIARGLALACLPAGIAIGPAVLADARPPWRPLWYAVAVATSLSAIVLALTGLVAPALAEPASSIAQMVHDMRSTAKSWEARNAAAWSFYMTIFTGVTAWLYAGIGIQVGAWATHSVPKSVRRPLFWAVGLGLLISGYAVADTTYETLVLHTSADASVAAFYTLLLPLSLFAGLGLPTLALLRRADLAGPMG